MKLKTALKHVFIPHEHNDYKPHFFREVSVAVIVVLSIFLLGFSAGSSFLIQRTVLGANISAAVLVDLTNESRLAFNEAPLVRSETLDLAAELKAADMAKNQYFAHDSPTGVTPWHWFKEAGYTFLYAGENLAVNFIEAKNVRDAWLESPTHRANLLDARFKEIGMATISGLYKDSPTVYIVQMFGTPAKAGTVRPVATDANSPVGTSTPPTSAILSATATSPEIKGESLESTPSTNATTSATYRTILNTPQLAVVKNVDNVEELSVSTTSRPYSKWYERFLFGGSYYVGVAYKVLLLITLVALLTMILVEIRKQHWRHIAYGLALLLVITLSLLINQALL